MGFVSAGTSTTTVAGNPPTELQARFNAPFARAGVCAAFLPLGARIGLRPCAAVLTTLTFSSGSGNIALTQKNAATLRIHGELGPRLDWEPIAGLNFYAGAYLLTSIYGAADKYQFDNLEAGGGTVEAYTVPTLAAGARLGMGARLP
jgi:hypothetical protein